MNKIIRIFSILIMLLFFSSSMKVLEEVKYKCMIQMKNYSGEGAYIIISLVDAEGQYIKTLKVQGNDEDWYH